MNRLILVILLETVRRSAVNGIPLLHRFLISDFIQNADEDIATGIDYPSRFKFAFSLFLKTRS